MKVTNKTRSEIFAKAWQIVTETAVSFAQALKDAWALVKLQALKVLMHAGTVSVTFRKLSGEITTRIATRNIDLVPAEKHPKTNKETAYTWALPFFDLTSNAWRSLTAQGIISFQTL